MANSIYTLITEATAYGARDRAYDTLVKMTGSEEEANDVIELVAEYNEFCRICREIEERKAATLQGE